MATRQVNQAGPEVAKTTDNHATQDETALTTRLPSEADVEANAAAPLFQTLADAQAAILNSQQANRDLIGVLIQDNFNLKSENHKLRDRMLVIERDLTELRRRDEARRDAVEARLQTLEAAINTLLEQLQRLQAQMRPAVRPADPAEPRPARGFWARLLGD